jgi:chemotaxis protein MotB
MLFEPGTEKILKEGLPVIDEVAAVLRELPNSIRVEGHTDNIPVNTERFPSNWDLSSARAISILKYFIGQHGYDPRKLSALGFGEYRPVDTNDTPSGRFKNRRVDIMVLNGDSVEL